MKKIFLMLALALPLFASAQLPQVEKLNNKYSNTEGVTAMTIDKQMISMFIGGAANLDFIDSISIIMTESAEHVQAIANDANKVIKKLNAETLITADNEGQRVGVYYLKDGDIFTNIFVTIKEASEAGFIAINGEIPQENIDELIQMVNQ